MTKTLRSLALASTTLALGLASLGSARADDPLEGRYEVVNTVHVEVPFYVAMHGTKDGKYAIRRVECRFLAGVDSLSAVCPEQQVSLPVELASAGTYTSILSVDYLALEIWAVAQGIDVDIIHSTSASSPTAEATWDGSQWVCSTSASDTKRCNATCGVSGGSVSALPEVQTNDPLAEPACEVTCSCNGGGTSEWLDQPDVLPSGA